MWWYLRNSLLSLMLALVSTIAWAEYLVLLADVELNHLDEGQRFFLWDGASEYYAEVGDLAEWRIRYPYPNPVVHHGKTYHPLSSFPGIRVAYEPLTVSLQLTVQTDMFEPQAFSLRRESPQASSAGIGGFLDYDWAYTDGVAGTLTGYMAPTLFSPIGSVNSDFLYRHSSGSRHIDLSNDGWLRLTTTYVLDDPEATRRYEVGDVTATLGTWAGWLRVGGVQIATNFDTRPNLNIYPSLTLGGEAGAPSTVDLYVNGQLRRREKIESGAFDIQDIPVINGDGQVQVVVTDIFGRQQIFSQDYYASNDLLSHGLHDYSYTLGALREDYGYESNKYGDMAFLGRHRYGVSDRLTMGGRFEANEEVWLGGTEAAWLAGRSGVLNSAVAVSDADAGIGALWSLGYEYHGRTFALGAQIAGSTSKFTSIRVDTIGTSPHLQFVLHGGVSAGSSGSLSMSYVRQSYHAAALRDDADVFTIGHNRELLQDFYLSIRASQIRAGDTDYSIGLTLTHTLGVRKSMTISADFARNKSRTRVETRSSVPNGPGTGYQVGTTLGDDKRVDGNFVTQTQFGRYQLDASRYDGQNHWRANMNGSVAWLAGRPYLSREIRNGFAVAEVGEFENVRVYVENHEVGRTDAHGRILLPALRPFERNRVSIESADLPLHVRVNTTRMLVSPISGTGTMIKFLLDASRSLTLQAIRTNGEPVPEGSLAYIEGRDVPLLVGLNGLLYVNGMNQPEVATVSWRGGTCTLEVPIPDSDHPLPNVGEVICEDEY